MSRIRKVDKQVLESSNEFLDYDDQTSLIDHLSTENVESYNNNRRYLTIALLVQIPVVMYLEHHYNLKSETAHLRFLLILLSDVLTLVNLRDFTLKVVSPIPLLVSQTVNVINVVICGQLLYSLFQSKSTLENLYLLLPSVNLGNLVLFQWWYMKIAQDVQKLNKLKYKFKTV